MADDGQSVGAFKVSFTEPLTGFAKEFVLSLFKDGTVSMYDVAGRKMFLKRCAPPEKLSAESFFIGATVVVCSRKLVVLAYADAATQRSLGSTRGSSLVLVKPDAYHAAGQVLQMLYNSGGLSIGRLRMVNFSRQEAEAFLGLTAGAEVASDAAAALAADHMLAIEVTGDDVIAKLQEVVGPANPADARAAAPSSIRAVMGTTRKANAVHTSLTLESARAEVSFIFERRFPYTATYSHCAAVVIKPHVVAAAGVGAVLDALLSAGVEVSAVRSVALSRQDAADLLEPYRGVCASFQGWVEELSSGPAVLLEVRGEGIVGTVRELAGPVDPVLARALRPHTLRARFGLDSVRNALHVTDVDVDGPLECKYLFHAI